MKSYVWLTFAFMGWGYYEVSGGAEFEPEQRIVAQTQAEALEIVARADTPTLMALSTSNVVPEPEATDAEITQVVAQAAALDAVETIGVVAPVIEPNLDIREVGGARGNMRMGPGTTFDVITTLNSGTKLEVLDVNAEGWANVSTERGVEGWVAERLLTAPET